jgi:hypothetical protein
VLQPGGSSLSTLWAARLLKVLVQVVFCQKASYYLSVEQLIAQAVEIVEQRCITRVRCSCCLHASSNRCGKHVDAYGNAIPTWPSVSLQEHTSLREMAEVPGLIPLLPEVLSRRPQQQQQHQHSDNANAAASRPNPSSPQVVPAVTTASSSTSSSSGVAGGVNMASMDVEVQGEAAGAAAEDADLEKAQAQLAWVVAGLASNRLTR